MSKMYIMIGMPGCGKSYYIKQHAKEGEVIVSRDTIRFNMLKDDEPYFAKEKAVYKEFIRQINAAVADGRDVWVDQTSINRGSRNKLFANISKPNEVIGIYFTTPLETAIERNAQRTGRAFVPQDAIINMYNSMEKPELDEGFTEIMEVE